MIKKCFVTRCVSLLLACVLLSSGAVAFADEIGSDPIVIPTAPETEKVESEPVSLPSAGEAVSSEPVSLPAAGETVDSEPVVIPEPAAPAEEPAAPAEEPAASAEEPAAPADEPAVPEDEPAEELPESDTVELKINKVNLAASAVEPMPGETVMVTVSLTAKNGEGAKLSAFVITVTISGGNSVRREFTGATVKNGEVYYKGAPLTVELECIPLTEEVSFATVRIVIADAAEPSRKLGSARMTFGEAPAEEAPAEEQPAGEIPTEELPVEEQPTEEAPAEDMPGEETPAEEQPAEETPAEEQPAEEAPAEEQPAEETPTEELPVEEAPAEELPAEETPTEELPVEETPAEELPTEDRPTEAALASEPEVILSMKTDKEPASLTEGDALTLIAVVEGLEEGTYSVRWQIMIDGAWTDIEGAVGSEYTLIYTEAVKGCAFRFIVTDNEPSAEEAEEGSATAADPEPAPAVPVEEPTAAEPENVAE